MNTWTLVTLVVYFVVMLTIGGYSYLRTSSHGDFMLGGRGLSPFTTALSAGASDMSGWLLLGLPGALYATGVVEAWIAIGLTVGAWLNWMLIAPRLRTYTEVAGNSLTIPAFFENRLHESSHLLRIIAGLVILFFFTFYVSSGMVAGGRFAESAFGADYLTGMLIIAAVVVVYTFIGGFLAVSYTDVVQGLLMLAALLVVPVVAVTDLGGPAATLDILREASPSHLDWFSASGAAIVSSLAWGLGYFGQPHIIVRFMALRDPHTATVGRRVGIGWMILSAGGAALTGLAGYAYLTEHGRDLGAEQSETVFLVLGQLLFHPAVAGVILAAVLAAIMSTISSQLLVTSSALIEDLYHGVFATDASPRVLVALSRLSVIILAVIAAVLALNPSDTILGLVAFAWAGFGAAFGPLVILSLYWRKLTASGAIAGMTLGAGAAAVWGQVPALSDALYEIVPGFALNMVACVVVSLMTQESRPIAVEEEFTEAVRRTRREERDTAH